MVALRGSCAPSKQRHPRVDAERMCLKTLLLLLGVCMMLISHHRCHTNTLLPLTIRMAMDDMASTRSLNTITVVVRIHRIPNLGWRMTMAFCRLPPPGNTTHFQSRLVSNQGQLGVQVPRTGRPSDRPIDFQIDSKDLRVMQWNAFHLKDHKIAELNRLAEETGFDILGICEVHPKDKPTTPGLLQGFDTPFLTTCKDSKGLVLYIRTGLYWRQVPQLTERLKGFQPNILVQAVEVTLPTLDNPVMIINTYVNPATKVPDRQEFWEALAKEVGTTTDFVLIGDLNESSTILSPFNTHSKYSFQVFENNC